MKPTLLPRGALVAAVSVVALVLGGCGSGPSGASATARTSTPATSSAPSGTSPAADRPFGAGCSTLPASGVGSAAALAVEPVGTAAGHSRALTALAAAVRRANLVDSLNGRRGITVLAPSDQAFKAVPAATLKALMADTAKLTQLLTHHVLEGRLTPAQLGGTHTTLNNDTVTIDGSGVAFTLSAGQTLGGSMTGRVICGNLQTVNATVYIIDQVLAPPAA